MQTVTKKSELLPLLQQCHRVYCDSGLEQCIPVLHQLVLQKKVKFPLLEHCGRYFFDKIAVEEHIKFCDGIASYKTIGGNVIIGIVLQKRLGINFGQSCSKAEIYIAQADSWHICDIIGERVFGHALLQYTEEALPLMKRLAKHSNNWVIRSLGAGFHNAIKWGLAEIYVKELFRILLVLGNSKDKEIKQGVGWAAKTTAKYHPKIIAYFNEKIQDPKTTGQWFRTKVRIGLERNSYAKGNKS